MRVAHSIPAVVAVAAAAGACLIGLRFGTYAAADTDPYGYVSQADLIASGSLRTELRATFPVIPGNDAAWAPAGYVLSADRRAVVPMYPPGLPLVMAAAQRVTGTRDAPFYVVPVLAALAVVATYFLGAASDVPATGAIASVLLATAPPFLVNTVQPVSDVAATAWWTVAFVCAVGSTPVLAVLAGLATSLAVLTRPHLVPLAAVLGLYLLLQPERWRKVLWFTMGALPGCLAVAAVNNYLHGSPLISGYGPLRDLFRVEHVLPNLDRYPRWLFQTMPFIYVGALAPLILLRRRETRPRSDVVWLAPAWAGVVFLLTIFYGYFGRDDWGYLRLMLPGVPPLLVLGATALRRVVDALPVPRAIALFMLLAFAGAMSAFQLWRSHQGGAFILRDVERRYVEVGRFIADTLPSSAVFISGLHSGSIRFYSGRLTIYYPRLRQGSLDLAIDTLGAQGRDIYVVLEDGEVPEFTARFATSAVSRLDWPAAHRTSRGAGVSIWKVPDRAR